MTIMSIPVNEVHVINPRARSKTKFAEIVGNIARVGLKRPITVRPRDDGGYELVCGQGRLEAFIALGETQIPAVVVAMSKEDLYVRSLIENLARSRPVALALAKEIVALKERGYAPADIAKKIDVTEGYVRAVQRLFASGEERLLVAVARKEIPVSVAVEIASARDADIRRALTEAYEKGQLKGKAVVKARALAEERMSRGKAFEPRRNGQQKKRTSAHDLVTAYRRETQRQAALVKRARACEQRLLVIGTGLRKIFKDEGFMNLLRAENFGKMPKYVVDQMKRAAP